MKHRACMIVSVGVLAFGCKAAPPEPEPAPAQSSEPAPAATAEPATTPVAAPAAAPTPKPAATVQVSPDDPLKGQFTLDDATKGLPSKGDLWAEIMTELGELECQLYADKAPITVANFVGLSRGLRPFKAPDGKWVKKPAYDGTTFHRVVKGFMVQGGDPEGTGRGEPGYVIPDEIWEGATHDRRGLLCMANRGPNTNGMQFFILDGPTTRLDSMGYTIFGLCTPHEVIDKLSSVEVRGDKSVNPTKITKVTIKRRTVKPSPAGHVDPG